MMPILFDPRGQIDAARKVAQELRTRGRDEWLEARWLQLRQERPLVILPTRILLSPSGDHRQTQHRELVDVRAIVEIDVDQRWGYLNNRMYVFGEMLDAIEDADRTGEWDAWARRWRDPITLLATRAGGKEIFGIAEGGRHRAMMAAALNFPQLPAIVYRNPPLEVGSTVLIPCDGDFDIEHADALTASGEIDGDFRDQGFWGGVVQVAPDADWWFDSPRAVAQLTTIFKRVHPAAELPPQMFFADEWIGYFDPSRASDEDDDDDPRTLLGRMRRFLERLGEPN